MRKLFVFIGLLLVALMFMVVFTVSAMARGPSMVPAISNLNLIISGPMLMPGAMTSDWMTIVPTATAPNHQTFLGLLENPRRGHVESEYDLANTLVSNQTGLGIQAISTMQVTHDRKGTLPGNLYLCLASVAFHKTTESASASAIVQKQRHNAAYLNLTHNTAMAIATRMGDTFTIPEKSTVLRL